MEVENPAQLAETAHRSGDFAEAVRFQREAVARCGPSGHAAVDSRKRLSLYLHSAGRNEEALKVLGEIRQLDPDDIESIENTGVILRMLGRREEAVHALREAHERAPDRANVCDALAHCLANMGEIEESQRFGRLSLELKDTEAAAREPLVAIPPGPPPCFDLSRPKKNVISFSLWGDHPRYLKGALRNAQAAVDIYPGWTVRFYCDDTVPLDVRRHLAAHGSEVVMRPRPASFFDGLLWRFEVVADPGVGRFLVRDCDSVVNVKERVAVDEWLASDRWFHAMRDFASHTEVILAGMWGGVAGVLPDVRTLREAFRPTTAPTRTFDQQLLREVVWPVVRRSVLVHDSVYTGCLGSVPFPPVGTLPPGYHVGQNEAAVRPEIFVRLPETRGTGEAPLFLCGMDGDAVAFVRRLLEALGVAAIPENPSIEEIRGAAGTMLASLGGEGDGEKVVAAVVSAVVRGLGAEAANEGRLGFCDSTGNVAFLADLARECGGHLLCVVRDPRDTASGRRVATMDDARGLAEDWNAHLSAVAKASRESPGAVELVRYEDLSMERSGATVSRMLGFLGLGGKPSIEYIPEAIDSGKPLPAEIAEEIERVGGKLLRKLHYLERPKAVARVELAGKEQK